MRNVTYKIRYVSHEPRATSHGTRIKSGFTLVEMLVVIAIVAVLATMVIGIAVHIESRKDQRRARRTLVLLSTALAQFHDYDFDYKGPYSAFDFPLDCNDFLVVDIENTLKNALGAGGVQISGAHDPNYSSNEVMYLLLSTVPTSRETLDKIDKKLIVSSGATITIDGRVYPLLRVIDPWGKELRYDYYNEKTVPPDPKTKRTFPVITSAGPDKEFGTDDDITSRD